MDLKFTKNAFHYSWLNHAGENKDKKEYVITGNNGYCWKCIKELNPNGIKEKYAYTNGEWKCLDSISWPACCMCVQYGWIGSTKEVCMKHLETECASPGACNVHNPKASIHSIPKACQKCITEMIEATGDLFKICKFPSRECYCKYCEKRNNQY